MTDEPSKWSAWFVIDDPREIGRVWCSHLHKTRAKAEKCARDGERHGYGGMRVLEGGVERAMDAPRE